MVEGLWWKKKSTGFSYSLTPSTTLVKTFRVLCDARVVLVNESFASQKCSRCTCSLEKEFNTKFHNANAESWRKRLKGWNVGESLTRKNLWGLRQCQCPLCTSKSLILRELNISLDIEILLTAIVIEEVRPLCLSENLRFWKRPRSDLKGCTF